MLPNRVARALGANERAKLRMSVLQAAMQHARDPEAPIPDFVAECGSTGLDAVTTRALVAGARTSGERSIEAPGLAKLCEALLARDDDRSGRCRRSASGRGGGAPVPCA
jgi:hypothetical protein